eukprot:9025641-Pyramimonas_sp.AAC.1
MKRANVATPSPPQCQEPRRGDITQIVGYTGCVLCTASHHPRPAPGWHGSSVPMREHLARSW